MNFNTFPAAGTITSGVFAYPVRIYYEDTDAGGIVYYANYLKFAERARTEFLRALGICQQDNLQQQQSGFVVRSCHIEYLASAVLDDCLTITCQLKELGAASATIWQNIYRNDEVIATLEVKVVHMNIAQHRPQRINKELAAELQKFMFTE